MKIDVTQIEGYSAMSDADKLKALEAFDLPDPDYTGWVKKEALDKATSEAAKYKKELRDKMSAEEAAKAAHDEEIAGMREELATLRTERQVDQHTAKFLGLGYDEKLARDTATALVKGDMETVFVNQAKFQADREKALKAQLLKGSPTPPPGQGGSAVDYEAKISEAQAAGDYSAAAYYMRLAQMEASKTK